MGLSTKRIASAATVVVLGTMADTVYGRATLENEDPSMLVRYLCVPGGVQPSIDDVIRLGTFLGPADSKTLEDLGGTYLSYYWAAAEPFVTPAGATVASKGYVCSPNNTGESFTTAAFTQPAVSSTVTVTMADTAWITAWIAAWPATFLASWLAANPTLAESDAPTAPTARIFIAGGGFYEITAVVDSISVTLTNLGIAGAVVTVTA